MPVRGKHDGKGDELSENVAEEELELAVQATPDHDRSDSHLEDGMRDPERVIENFNFLVHLLSLVGEATLMVWTRTARFLAIRPDVLVRRS